MKDAKMKRGELPRFGTSYNEMLACSREDTRRGNMLSRVGKTGVSEVEANSKSGKLVVMKPNVQV
jgi:hypothetical protein